MATKRLYKFYSQDSAMLNLRQERLKVSLVNELNDPFESNPYLFESAEDRKTWRKIMLETWNGKGLICFSAGWSNPVMWSHYTDSHKGLALGFDVGSDNVFPVTYRPTKRRLRSLQDIVNRGNPSALEDAVLIKYAHWEYEDEWRLFLKLGERDPNEKHHFEPFSDRLRLREVIIGERSTVSSNEIRSIVASSVKVVTARLAFRTFRVVEQRDRNYQK